MIRFFSPLNLGLLAVLLLVTLAGFLFVPADMRLPVHWGVTGEADITLPRNWALLQLPAVVAAIWAIFWAIEHWGSRGRGEASAAVLSVTVSAITGLMVWIQILVVLVGLGVTVNVIQAVVGGMALVQIALGNVMPKSRPNAVAGIRVRTALADPANWTATHRLAGLLMMIAGLLLLAAALLLPVGSWLLIAAVVSWLLPLAAGAAYSAILARRQAG